MLNKELFYQTLPQIAEALTVKPTVFHEIEQIYNEDKLLYYTNAKEHPLFSDEYLTNGTLERELNIQKVLGVIICAEKDERLQNRLIKILSKYYSVWFTLVKNKPRDFPIKFRNEILSLGVSADWMENNSHYRIPYYLIRLVYGLNFEPLPQFQQLITIYEDEAKQINTSKPFTDLDLERNKSDDLLTFYKKYEKFLSNYKSCKDINLFLDAVDGINPLVTRFKSDPDDLKKNILQTKRFITLMFEIQELSSTLITNHISISRYELRKVLVALAVINGWKIDTIKKMSSDQVVQYYIFGIFLQTILKEYKNAKQLSRENSNEIKLLEFNSLEKEIEKLRKQNDILLNENKNLIQALEKEKISVQTARNLVEKEMYGEVKQLLEENDFLRKKVEGFGIIEQEVFKLREFVFALQNDDDLIEEPIEDFVLPPNKKIILVGGHENWQKKVKEKYPSLTVVDGTNTNQDIRLFENSDLVLFHTPHMSHATMNKIMSHINKKKIPYGFTSYQHIPSFSKQLINALTINGITH